MKRFIFIMQHAPTPVQLATAKAIGEVVQLADNKLLVVPDDVNLDKQWFEVRAGEIVYALGGISSLDTIHCIGQQQLSMAVNARGRKVGARIVESVISSMLVDRYQPNGEMGKEMVFPFLGFRTVYSY